MPEGFHGDAFKALLKMKKYRLPGQLGFILGELRDAVLKAKRYTLELLGLTSKPDGSRSSSTLTSCASTSSSWC